MRQGRTAEWQDGRMGRTKASTGRRAGCIVVALLLTLAPRLAADDTLDQGARLSALVKVWGLLKYYHPQVAQGTSNWDQALVHELPRIQATPPRGDFNDEIVRLIRSAGATPRQRPGTSLDDPETD